MFLVELNNTNVALTVVGFVVETIRANKPFRTSRGVKRTGSGARSGPLSCKAACAPATTGASMGHFPSRVAWSVLAAFVHSCMHV